MPSQTSVLLDAVGPMLGYGMPFGGIYSNVYGTTPGAQTAESNYWGAINRGYENQQQQLLRDAFGKITVSSSGAGPIESFELGNAVTYNPQTGAYEFDINKVPGRSRDLYGDAQINKWYQEQLGDSNEDKAQARQQLEALAQKRAAMTARTQQQEAERQGFVQELQRYNAPDLMTTMITPQIQNAGNQVMANANAAGAAGGSFGQAANRRAAMTGFGMGAAAAVPQAAMQQADLNFNYQKAREGMINNYYNMQNQRAQQDIQNQMAQTGFQKSMEEYEHNRSMEALKMGANFAQNLGAAAFSGAPLAGRLGGGGGEGG